MLTRFDHAVIAVRDLQAAMATFRRLGFDVQWGGIHPGMGTANAVIRFGLDYIELLSVVDRPAGQAAGPVVEVLIEHLERREGFVGYSFTSDDIESDAARVRAAGLDVLVMPLSRVHPGGVTLCWSLAFPEGMPWLRPWPFLIQCHRTDDERLRIEQPRRHRNGARRCRGAVVAVADLEAADRLLAGQVGLARVGGRFKAGAFTVQPSDRVPGPGLAELRIAVSDLAAARRALPDDSVAGASEQEVRIDPAASAGAQLVLVPDPADGH